LKKPGFFKKPGFCRSVRVADMALVESRHVEVVRHRQVVESNIKLRLGPTGTIPPATAMRQSTHRLWVETPIPTGPILIEGSPTA
jgi:hypothetical protein